MGRRDDVIGGLAGCPRDRRRRGPASWAPHSITPPSSLSHPPLNAYIVWAGENHDVTLSISVHQRDPESGDLGPNLVVETGADLAGFEVWRTSVYGSAAVRQRGAHFLPQLARADLMLEGSDLVPFRKECADLIDDIAQLSSELKMDVETLRFRLSNIAAATDQAIAVGGVVWVA